MDHLRAVWRISLGLGAIPPLSVFYFRLRMKEGDRYAQDGMRHVKIPYWLVLKKYWSRLLPVSLIWFIYDFSAYSFGIYSSTILDRVIPNSVFSLVSHLTLDALHSSRVERRLIAVLSSGVSCRSFCHRLSRTKVYSRTRRLPPSHLRLHHVRSLRTSNATNRGIRSHVYVPLFLLH